MGIAPIHSARQEPGVPVAQVTPDSSAQVTDTEESLFEHLDLVAGIVGSATLLTILPLARTPAGARSAVEATTVAGRATMLGRWRQAASSLARTAVGRLPGGSAAMTAAAEGSARLRHAREALGSTAAGKVLLAAQGPVGVAGIAINGALLVRDTDRWRDGRGGFRPIVLDLIGVLPALGGATKAVLRSRAAARELQAAETATHALQRVEATTSRAISTAPHAATELPEVSDELARTVSVAREAQGIAETSFDVAPIGRLVAPPTPRRVVERAIGPQRSSLAVNEMRQRVQTVATQAAQSRNVVVDALDSPPAPVIDRLDDAVGVARSAEAELGRLAQRTESLAVQAARADQVQRVAGDTSAGANLLNSGVTFVRSQSSGDHSSQGAGAVSIGRNAVNLFLRRNGATTPGAPTSPATGASPTGPR